MSKVSERCQKTSAAKFFYASRSMYREVKVIKLTLYILSIVPIVLSVIPAVNNIENLTFAVTMIAFLLNIIAELGSSIIGSHKEKAILLQQLYEAEITATNFSKIEYDRELTNELNELAIRKALPRMQKIKKFHDVSIDPDISDEYAYLYLCRTNSAQTKYLMSRMFYVYIALLIGIVTLFIGFAFIKKDTKDFLQLVIQFYPLLLPIIRNINGCSKSMKYCSKIDADIDNFFADGDDSVERLARFQYYVQNIEFEMYSLSPARYAFFPFIFKHGMKVLSVGVTHRFVEAIKELKKKALIGRGVTVKTNKMDIVSHKEVTLEELERKERLLKERKTATIKSVSEPKALPKPKTETKPAVKKTTAVKVVKTETKKTPKK